MHWLSSLLHSRSHVWMLLLLHRCHLKCHITKSRYITDTYAWLLSPLKWSVHDPCYRSDMGSKQWVALLAETTKPELSSKRTRPQQRINRCDKQCTTKQWWTLSRFAQGSVRYLSRAEALRWVTISQRLETVKATQEAQMLQLFPTSLWTDFSDSEIDVPNLDGF